jgi:hypothetical protein
MRSFAVLVALGGFALAGCGDGGNSTTNNPGTPEQAAEATKIGIESGTTDMKKTMAKKAGSATPTIPVPR